MLNYTCVKCNRELRCIQNEVYLVHFTDDNKNQGIDAMRVGDLYRCPQCGTEVVLGMGTQVLGMDMDRDYQNLVMKSNKLIEVKRL